MNVSVMSRSDAIRYCHQPHNNKTIMVSISDPYIKYPSQPFSSDKNGVLFVVRLFFTDADRPGKDVYGRDVSEADLMTETDALMIRRILKRYPDTDIIVHCDAGISRSSGVAAGILKALTGDDTKIFNSPRFRPNMRCYRLVLEALTEEGV